MFADELDQGFKPGSQVTNVCLVPSQVFGTDKPVDGFFEPGADVVSELEAGEFADFGVVTPQAEHLRLARAQALFVGQILHVAAHQLFDHVEGVANRHFKIQTNFDSYTT